MTLAGFRKAGHTPTLLSAFLYFDVSFMVWVMLGPLMPFLRDSLKVSPGEMGFLIALPLLSGSFFRPVLGALADRWGGRSSGILGLCLTLVPLLYGWQFASTYTSFCCVAIMLGIAGASFAVALPLAGAWYPPEYQGLAMGIAGAGNSGTLVATLFAPRLALALGWHQVFALALIPVSLVLVFFIFVAKDSPKRPKPVTASQYAAVLKEADAGWFCLLYALTFGSFVGFASFLTVFFHDQYGLTRVQAGDFTTLTVLAGSFFRPVGGLLADRFGGYRLLLLVLAVVAIGLAIAGTLPAAPVALALLVIVMAMLGMGNGAVFQMLPQRFPDRMGVLTGIVGAAGGLGGFFLPSLLGLIRERSGQYGAGLLFYSAVMTLGACTLLLLGPVWKARWTTSAASRTGIFSFRRTVEPALDLEEAA